MSMIFYHTKLKLSKYNGSWAVSVKQNTNFSFQITCIFVLSFPTKNGLTETCSSFEDQHTKMSWSHDDKFKFCIHLRSLNIHNFGMVEVMGL
jgi:hypothetical protein